MAGHLARAGSKAPTTSTLVLRRVAHGFTNPDNYAASGMLVT